MKRLLLATVATIGLAACAGGPTAPVAAKNAAANRASQDDLLCASGYIIAYDENGDPYCAPAEGGNSHNGVATLAGVP